jgi:hypothetical protein
MDDAEEALSRTGDALKAAWEGSREARMSALEAAREAANRLGEAIDKGVAVARESWEAGGGESAARAPEDTEGIDDAGESTDDAESDV